MGGTFATFGRRAPENAKPMHGSWRSGLSSARLGEIAPREGRLRGDRQWTGEVCADSFGRVLRTRW
jgi:hypothetical protein